MKSENGVLHVVATPIGNLGDISERALSVLRSVDLICAEDTRHTRPLLAHFGIDKPLFALHDHNEEAASALIIERMQAGASVALVSDAGTPLVSDPGFRLVRATREAGIKVTPVPGASALIAALSVAGLPSDRFVFEGFLSNKASARRERMQQLAVEPRTLIFYESSHRIVDHLEDALTAFGAERHIVIARELTKLFETVLDGSIEQVLARVKADSNQQKGEFVVLVSGAPAAADSKLHEGMRIYKALTAHLKPSVAAKIAAELSGAPRKALYGGNAEA